MSVQAAAHHAHDEHHAHHEAQHVAPHHDDPDLEEELVLEKELSPSQKFVESILESKWTKVFMGAVILLNSLQVAYESDIGAKCKWEKSQEACDQEDGWLRTMNIIYLVIYSIEMMARIYVHRSACFFDSWDVFDSAIILLGAASEILGGLLPSPGILRLVRLARLFKAVRILKLPPELYIMIHGFLTALKAIAMGAVLIFFMLALWSVVAVEVLNDLNHEPEMVAVHRAAGCERCEYAWSSMANAILTFTRFTIMGDGWGALAVPMIEAYPWTAGIYVAVYFTVVLGMTNLILAVIVDKALQAHEDNLRQQAQAHEAEKKEAKKKFIHVCAELDSDGSGKLTLDELLAGYDSVQDFQDTCTVMDIHREDMKAVFKMMDSDQSGDVSSAEFAEKLCTIRDQDSHTLLTFIKYYVSELHQDNRDILARLRISGLVTDDDGQDRQGEVKGRQGGAGESCQHKPTLDHAVIQQERCKGVAVDSGNEAWSNGNDGWELASLSQQAEKLRMSLKTHEDMIEKSQVLFENAELWRTQITASVETLLQTRIAESLKMPPDMLDGQANAEGPSRINCPQYDYATPKTPEGCHLVTSPGSDQATTDPAVEVATLDGLIVKMGTQQMQTQQLLSAMAASEQRLLFKIHEMQRLLIPQLDVKVSIGRQLRVPDDGMAQI
eukprot:gnl/TRDRNA2_/TRDRNA2_94283_c0_seq1.p1 gnl/TRDRNA2_/TRDRNA2_94283_c0~~gnl/TRDRNA2_/TRDRNA2_94283_c0_seq1.p1  ORF type:complete len:668 (+),score=137.83 gnl/TRDRNA2_/TRDRNA2_94283_c0_seq1:104-2107(+)